MELITPAGATLASAPPAITVVIVFGISLGLRPDILVAGFSGALATIILLGSVPNDGDTWQHLLRTTTRRIFVTLASSLTAGYLTPLALSIAKIPDPFLLGGAFVVGASAQHALRRAIKRITEEPMAPKNKENSP